MGGDSLFVDLRPGTAHGCVGEYTTDGWTFNGPRWPSVATMLADIAAAARVDRPVGGFHLWADDEGLDWTFRSGAGRWAMGGSSFIDPIRFRNRFAEAVQAYPGAQSTVTIR